MSFFRIVRSAAGGLYRSQDCTDVRHSLSPVFGTL